MEARTFPDFNIPCTVLNGQDNYYRWRCDILRLAELHDVRDLLEGIEKTLPPAKPGTDADAYEEQMERRKIATTLLFRYTRPALRTWDSIDYGEPRRIWKWIENRHMPDREFMRQLTRARIDALRVEKCNGFADFIYQLDELVDDLKEIGAKFRLDDKKKIEILLMNVGHISHFLPEELHYRAFIGKSYFEIAGQVLLAEAKAEAARGYAPNA